MGPNPAIELAHTTCTTRTSSTRRRCSAVHLPRRRRRRGRRRVGATLHPRAGQCAGACCSELLQRSLERRATDEREPIDRIVAAAGRRLADMHALLGAADGRSGFRAAPSIPRQTVAVTAERAARAGGARVRADRARRQRRGACGARLARATIERIIAEAPLRGDAGDPRARRLPSWRGAGDRRPTCSSSIPASAKSTRPPAQRRRRTSPFADLATMIRSLDEADGRGGLRRRRPIRPCPAEVVRSALRELVRVAATTFGRSYLEHARELGALDRPMRTGARLVRLFLVRATLEAIVYQAHERPERMRDLYAEFGRIFERTEAAVVVTLDLLGPVRAARARPTAATACGSYAPAATRVDALVGRARAADGRATATGSPSTIRQRGRAARATRSAVDGAHRPRSGLALPTRRRACGERDRRLAVRLARRRLARAAVARARDLRAARRDVHLRGNVRGGGGAAATSWSRSALRRSS